MYIRIHRKINRCEERKKFTPGGLLLPIRRKFYFNPCMFSTSMGMCVFDPSASNKMEKVIIRDGDVLYSTHSIGMKKRKEKRTTRSTICCYCAFSIRVIEGWRRASSSSLLSSSGDDCLLISMNERLSVK